MSVRQWIITLLTLTAGYCLQAGIGYLYQNPGWTWLARSGWFYSLAFVYARMTGVPWFRKLR
jgi:hypothetical protein